MRNFFTRRRSSPGRSRTVHNGTSRGSDMRRGSLGGTVEMAIGALVVVVLVLVLLRLVGLF